jgi:hypothetical protein
VSLWPLFYAGLLGFPPNLVHARLMIEAFGGAFLVGGLAIAATRFVGPTRFALWETLWLFWLLQAAAIAHLNQRHAWVDACFVVLLASLLITLAVRLRQASLLPQIALVATGLICGIAGAGWLMLPGTVADVRTFRLANLFLDQGFLLASGLGMGSVVFPRMLGEAPLAAEGKVKVVRAVGAGLLLVGSFFLESWGQVLARSGGAKPPTRRRVERWARGSTGA